MQHAPEFYAHRVIVLRSRDTEKLCVETEAILLRALCTIVDHIYVFTVLALKKKRGTLYVEAGKKVMRQQGLQRVQCI